MLVGDKLSVSYQMPLAVTKGQMIQHSVKRYTSSDRHRNIDETFYFAVKSRHQMQQLDYYAALSTKRYLPLQRGTGIGVIKGDKKTSCYLLA